MGHTHSNLQSFPFLPILIPKWESYSYSYGISMGISPIPIPMGIGNAISMAILIYCHVVQFLMTNKYRI